MSDLPNPIMPQNPQNAGVPAATTVQSAQTADPKVLKEQTIQKLEAVIAQTPVNPAERAVYIHQLKADFIRQQYGIDSKDKP